MAPNYLDSLRRLARPRDRPRPHGPGTTSALDLALVVAPQNRGWVLETICRELAARHWGKHAIYYGEGRLPSADFYFFSHVSLFLEYFDQVPTESRSLVFFTHPSYPPSASEKVARRLSDAYRFIAMASLHQDALVAAGLPPRQVTLAMPGADPERFVGHRRGEGAVGLCSAYYPRKSPDTILGLVRTMPQREFRLLGRNWEDWPMFETLRALPNLSYEEASYESYPQFYDGIDVFVSPARMEGGPLPLLEAMMANSVPVATRTGFAPDLIVHGENGLLCEPDSPVEHFAELVEQAYGMQADVRATVSHRTWDAFAESVLAELPGPRP